MASTAAAHKLFTARPSPGPFFDLAVTAVALAATLLLLSHGGIDAFAPGSAIHAPRPLSGNLDLLGVVLAACSTVPLLAWRRFPLGVFVVTALAGVAMAGLGYRLGLMLGSTAALYLLAASRQRQTPWTLRTSATVAGLFVAYLSAATADQAAVPGLGKILLHVALPWAVAWFAGERARLRHEQMAELKERALRVEREAERERQLAAAEERARIARDLHDSAGHAINVIAVRAGAARLRHPQDPDHSLLVLGAIEELARNTVEEIDQLVGTLREGGAANGAVEAPPGLGSLDTLVARHAAAGLEITVDASGTPRTLGAAADQASYRILQEALTNAARHGSGSARVELVFHNEAVEVTVTNAVPARRSSRSRGGHGLIGMHERATLLGGSLDVERANGTFCVRARIPYRGRHA